ncbi:MAG: type I DNA topoisomerase [Lachnospiraceae bacterium]|nr:type I DNA topoisomerase [Lachnospiraceae bacterium]
MAKNLVIMESPAKAKTVKKYLGSNYEVLASGGHVRDLPKSSLGVDVNADFDPHYITIRGKGDVLAALRREVKKADKIYLATDPDREGEAIAWHLLEVLKPEPKKTYRITFNEITKNAVKNSMKNAREIDMNLVDAQQARRILDRMVGYEISPILWGKVKRGLSAGRVQSAALRMICDREAEIGAFVKEEYWTLSGDFTAEGEKKPVSAVYYGKKKKAELKKEADCDKVLEAVKDAKFTVTEVKEGERRKNAPLPFTTSTLQQEAAKTLNFTTQKTMRVAQQLYEGVDVKGHGTLGLITYLRTDSTRISEEADAAVKKYIADEIGKDYLGGAAKAQGGDRRIQDAHEAIRPSYVELTPDALKNDLSKEQLRLYQLIWKRFVASRMKDAVYASTTLKIEGNGHVFTGNFSSVKFDGYEKVYSFSDDEEKTAKKGRIPAVGTVFASAVLTKEQHFTQPPSHFTEASLVKTMEETGIGRPSTYAPTITTLLSRHYVSKEGKALFVTDLGEAVNELMKQAFPSIVATDFTATMETLLDGVEEGNVQWKNVVRNFYPDLHEAVKEAQDSLNNVKIADEVSDVVCELCGRQMVYKYGPHGKFLACPGFPECRNTKQILERTGIPCPKCGKELVMRRTRKGRRYFGCEGYPECDYMSWQKP